MGGQQCGVGRHDREGQVLSHVVVVVLSHVEAAATRVCQARQGLKGFLALLFGPLDTNFRI